MNLYHEQFLESHDYPRVEKPSKILIIASTARSGSHMLGHALHNTNSFGYPLEYSNPQNLSEWGKLFGKEGIEDIITEVQQRRTSPNGVFGIKIHYSHIMQFGGFARLKKTFPNAYYVLLTRHDVLKQAVSLSIAKQTGVWIAGQKQTNNNPNYNFKDINKNLRQIIMDNSSWRYILAANGCKFVEMNHDLVCNRLTLSIDNIAKFMGVEVDIDSIPTKPVTKKQGSDLNIEWEQKFLCDYNHSELLNNGKINLIDLIRRKFYF